jgi:hypothetical protein
MHMRCDTRAGILSCFATDLAWGLADGRVVRWSSLSRPHGPLPAEPNATPTEQAPNDAPPEAATSG